MRLRDRAELFRRRKYRIDYPLIIGAILIGTIVRFAVVEIHPRSFVLKIPCYASHLLANFCEVKWQ